ncbi:NUMOD4 domain-containing protein [Brevibacillus sp. 179-C9.3 HS]|uniref:NUMOD4 domain-containing protein n=1 Tax=unclassified Brevibacillus TaxID=2684853 RepID=UPI0039A29276
MKLCTATESQQDEVWKDVVGYEGIYRVSSFGRVKSLANGSSRKEKILKSHVDRNGYVKLDLSKKGQSKKFYVHRLVAQAFIPNSLNKSQVNHRDGVKTMNHASNLEWCTPSENVKHAYSIGLTDRVKPVLAVNLDTNERLEFVSRSDASRHLGVSTGNIYDVLKGKSNHANGWKFEQCS